MRARILVVFLEGSFSGRNIPKVGSFLGLRPLGFRQDSALSLVVFLGSRSCGPPGPRSAGSDPIGAADSPKVGKFLVIP